MWSRKCFSHAKGERQKNVSHVKGGEGGGAQQVSTPLKGVGYDKIYPVLTGEHKLFWTSYFPIL